MFCVLIALAHLFGERLLFFQCQKRILPNLLKIHSNRIVCGKAVHQALKVFYLFDRDLLHIVQIFRFLLRDIFRDRQEKIVFDFILHIHCFRF